MKWKHPLAALVFLSLMIFTGCAKGTLPSDQASTNPFYPSSKPFVRWWWFATEIRKPDIRYQLDWLKEKKFGGVEIAWVYPLYRYQKMYAEKYNRHYPIDTSAQEWLSPEWSDMIAYAKAYADSIGLSCDFTFGSAWPVAGSNIDK